MMDDGGIKKAFDEANSEVSLFGRRHWNEEKQLYTGPGSSDWNYALSNFKVGVETQQHEIDNLQNVLTLYKELNYLNGKLIDMKDEDLIMYEAGLDNMSRYGVYNNEEIVTDRIEEIEKELKIKVVDNE